MKGQIRNMNVWLIDMPGKEGLMPWNIDIITKDVKKMYNWDECLGRNHMQSFE